jgi:hypothetical protein
MYLYSRICGAGMGLRRYAWATLCLHCPVWAFKVSVYVRRAPASVCPRAYVPFCACAGKAVAGLRWHTQSLSLDSDVCQYTHTHTRGHTYADKPIQRSWRANRNTSSSVQAQIHPSTLTKSDALDDNRRCRRSGSQGDVHSRTSTAYKDEREH